MIKSVRFLLLLIAFVSMQIVAWGQPQERLVQVQVTPDHTNWLYKPGEIQSSGIEMQYPAG